MDNVDRKILTLISKAFPVERNPYRKIADAIGINEDEAFERVKKLRLSGMIRRIGATINPRKIGWVSTLCGVHIPEDKIDRYASIVNGFPEVTHNYVRSGIPNCWFTIIARNKQRCDEIIEEVSKRLDARVLDLPASRVFKTDVHFRL